MRLKRVGVIAAGLGLLGLAGVRACYYFEDRVATYATYAQAETAGAMQSGYLPVYVPHGARDIRSVYNVDTNEQWLRFEAPESELRRMAQVLTPLSYADIRAHRAAPPRWRGPWPSEVGGFTIATPRGQQQLGLYAASGQRLRCVAVEWRDRLAYAWTC
jgi:hypothetical protein